MKSLFLFIFLYGTTVTAQSGCTTSYTGLAIDGNDLNGVQGTSSSCCKFCQQKSGCTAYTWTNFNGGTCWLKNGTQPLYPDSSAFSGILSPTPSNTYSLHKKYAAPDFFDNFFYNSNPKDTFGYSNFTNQTEAQGLNLTGYSNGKVYISADSTITLPNNSHHGRPTIRIDSLTRYSSGLFILSVDHIPEGPGTWPAFWTDGLWPNNGEIDVLESYNVFANNHISLHTGADCFMHSTDNIVQNFNFSLPILYFNGTWYGENANISLYDCYRSAEDSNDLFQGCHILAPNGTFNTPFNKVGGGAYAMQWDREKFIRIWDFPKPYLPADIANESPNPNPDTWGIPHAYFPLGPDCDPMHFYNNTLIFNIAFCGGPLSDFNGNYTICKEYVATHPESYKDTYFLINYLKVFCRPGEPCEKDTPYDFD